MIRNQHPVSIGGMIVLVIVLLNAIVIKSSFEGNENNYWWLALTLPLLFIALWDVFQKKHAIKRNFPLVGHLRYLLETIRPELRQYFFESDLDGRPFNRRQRSIVYQRAKNERQTVAFGMQADPYKPGFEWAAHSIYPSKVDISNMKVEMGNDQCLQPYQLSIYNIGAMSYGALSKTAIRALNEGARIGGFAHNTGEGGISEHHLKGGDLIWQIGTGYFGCRNQEGRFDPIKFRKNALRQEVRMIELKLSQGAKPGHGGILPAKKNTPEIALIRNVDPGTTVHSPGSHSEFEDAEGMIRFIQLLRELSGGKPVGFKLCIGITSEFEDICKAIKRTGIVPDFITVDGAEGGTGAAPLEFTDHLGMPLNDALVFVNKTLSKYRLEKNIRIIASGKIITGFDILKVLSLGASACYSSRGMMMALGCIQALICDSGKCPVGIATQNPQLYKGLDPADKSVRVANFHANTIKATIELMEACGFNSIENIRASSFFRRINEQEIKSFEEIYLKTGKNYLKEKISFISN